LNFSTLQARVAGETGLDATADATTLGIWVNLAYKSISGMYDWPWLLKQATLQTVADITTGTVSINAGSSALTFSSGPVASVATQYMIQFAASDDWYIISAHNAGATAATLANPYNATGNLTGGTYKLRKTLYSLASDLDRIIDIRQARTDQKLTPVDIRTFDKALPDPTSTGNPILYAPVGMDSSNNWQITVYPISTVVMNLQYRYLQIPPDLTGTQAPIMPEKFHDSIVMGALYLYGHAFIDDSRLSAAKSRADELLSMMKRECDPVPDGQQVIRPWDQRIPTNTLNDGILGANYPYPWRQ
jgi:hypothetical protein